MAMTAPQLPTGGEPLLPPEVTIDTEPITDDDLERWSAMRDQRGDAGPPDLATDDLMPEAMRAFADETFDPERAEWAMAKLAQLRVQLAEQDERRQAYIDRIERWFAKSTRHLSDSIAYFEGVLKNMLRQANEADPSVKSVTLPSGSITSAGPTKGNEFVAHFHPVDGETDVLRWAKAHMPDLVHVKEWVLIGEVRKRLWRVDADKVTAVIGEGADQEVVEVPGLVPFEKRRTFDVKPIV